MKNLVYKSVKELFTNRYLATLSIMTILLALLMIGYILLAVHPADIQQVVRGTMYGQSHLYTDVWYYFYNFGILAAIAAIIHVAIALKIYPLKGHSLAIMFVWIGFGLIILDWVVAFRLINILSVI